MTPRVAWCLRIEKSSLLLNDFIVWGSDWCAIFQNLPLVVNCLRRMYSRNQEYIMRR